MDEHDPLEPDDLDDDDLDESDHDVSDPGVTVEVTGLSLFTRHGVTPAERELGQRLLIDLSFDVTDCDAMVTDRVEDTVDYADACEQAALAAQERSYSPTFMYRALQTGDVDVISAFSSDGRIASDSLELLADPKQAIPSYDAVLLISPRRANDPLMLRALEPLIGKITQQRMQEANFMVDRDIDKVSPREAARLLARSIGVAIR